MKMQWTEIPHIEAINQTTWYTKGAVLHLANQVKELFARIEPIEDVPPNIRDLNGRLNRVEVNIAKLFELGVQRDNRIGDVLKMASTPKPLQPNNPAYEPLDVVELDDKIQEILDRLQDVEFAAKQFRAYATSNNTRLHAADAVQSTSESRLDNLWRQLHKAIARVKELESPDTDLGAPKANSTKEASPWVT